MVLAHVTVALRKGRLFIIPSYSPGRGTFIDKEPVIEVESFDDQEIGQAVLNGFDDFVEGGKMPDWDTYRSPALRSAGVGSWSDYSKGLKECFVSLHDDHFELRGDHEPITIPRDSHSERIGKTVLQSLGTTKDKEIKKRKKKKKQ